MQFAGPVTRVHALTDGLQPGRAGPLAQQNGGDAEDGDRGQGPGGDSGMFAGFGEDGELANHGVMNLFFEAVVGRVVEPVVVRLIIGMAIAHHRGREPGEQGLGQAGQGRVEAGDQPPSPAHGDLANGVGGAVQNAVGDDMGGVDRLRIVEGLTHQVPSVLVVGRVDRRGFDQGHRHGSLLAHQLHSKGVGEPLHRVFRGGIDALHRDGRVRQDRADVDDRPAGRLFLQVLRRHQRTVDHAPVVGLEQPSLVFQAGVLDRAEDRHARVVDPGIEAAEQPHGLVRGLAQGVDVGDIGDGPGAAAPVTLDLLAQRPEIILTARHEKDTRPRPRRAARGGQADTGRGAGDHQRLIFQGFQSCARRHSGPRPRLIGTGRAPARFRPLNRRRRAPI